MKKILLVLLMGMFLISLVSPAVIHLGTFERNSCVDLPQDCTTCTYNNISRIYVENRGSPILSEEISMVRSGISPNLYNYTFCNTSIVGEYLVTGHGDLDGTDTIFNYGFGITETGFVLESSESMLYIVILIAAFILFLGFLYPAIALPYSNKTNADGSITRIAKAKYFKLLSIWFAYGFLMWFLQTLNLISVSFIKLTNLTNFITNIFTYSWGISVGVTFLIIFIILIETWKDIILSNTIKKFGKAFTDGRLQ